MIIDILIILVSILLIVFLWIIYTRAFGAEFVQIPKKDLKAMVKTLHLNKNDILYDLGCGTGRILIKVSLKVKQGIGIEIDLIRFLILKIKTRNKKNIKIIYGNLFKIPLKDATAITVFLSKEANIKLGKKLKKELKDKNKKSKRKDIRIVSYKWPIPSPNLKLAKHDKKHRIFLYYL